MRTNRFLDQAKHGRPGMGAATHVMIAALDWLLRAGLAAGSGRLRLGFQSARALSPAQTGVRAG